MRKEAISQFPITEHLDSICQTLKKSMSKTLILTAETAAGKSTILPLALLEQFEGKILMTEPRRLAVLGVANRVSELCENPQSVGYKIHLESSVTKATRLEVVTEGILVRQLQADPLLENYNVIVIDEFHERSINTDLIIAFLKEALQLRDDLYVIIMSATMDTKKLQNYLMPENGAEVPVMQIPGRLFPVETSYDEKSSVSKAVINVLRNGEKGDILVFLPGIADIRKTKEELENLVSDDIEILILHSSISLEEQKRVILPRKIPDTKKRVILSSAIAETSLTVPNITCVIDSGLVRINRMNISIGMENLSTEVESEFSAQQRAGRAGRICEGKCIRLWFKGDPRVKEQAPEILRADITNLVLECCARGICKADGIDWLDIPNKGAWAEAVKLLQRLGFLNEDSKINEKGKAALKLGVHPRLAGIAIEGFKNGKLLPEAEELLVKYSEYSKSSREIQKRFIGDLERRLQGTEISIVNATSAGLEKSLLVLAGYPDRLARRETAIGIEPAEYQFASGRKAKLQQGKAPLWIVAPEVMAGKSEGVIFEFEGISEEKLQEFVEIHAKSREKCSFLNGKLKKSEEICYGEIVLSSKNIPASSEDYAAAWVNEVHNKGFEALPLDEKLEKFLMRVEFYRQEKLKNDGEQSLRQELQDSVEEWLVPFLGSVGGGGSLSPQVVYDALYWFVDGAEVDRLVPEVMVLPNGRRCKVTYEKQNEIKPIIEIIIQRIFGCFETPEICGKKVLLRLLSPASRLLQVTEDLEGFWNGAWPDICKEMKGRYPKHNWDYKVVEKN